MIYALIPALMWALGSVCTARSAKLLGVTATNRWRLAIAVVLLGAWVAVGPGIPINRTVWGWLLFSGVVGLGLGDLAMLGGYRHVGARITVMMLLCLAVPISGISEWLWLGTPLGLRDMVLSAGILFGVGMAVMPGAKIPAVNRRAILLGLLYGVGAALGQGLGTTLSRVAYQAAADAGIAVVGVTAAWQRMIGGLACTLFAEAIFRMSVGFPPAQLAGEALAPGGHPRRQTAWLWLGGSVVLGPLVGLSVYQWVLINQPGALVQAVTALTPVIVIPFAWWIDGDRPDWRGVVGGCLACACAILLAVLR
jgi:drug/metabolite transporter (DMT)-like permease